MGTLRRASLVVVAALAVIAGVLTATNTATAADPGTFTIRPSVNQLYVLDATPGQELELVDSSDAVVGSGTVDAAGQPRVARARRRRLHRAHHRRARDGIRAAGRDRLRRPGSARTRSTPGRPSTKASATSPPATAPRSRPTSRCRRARVPFPTVVEYSGYDPSNPDEHDRSPQLYNTLGFAYVGVNIRGTGCSGGSFHIFEPIQSLDGYDAIETVAAQPWAKFHKVGMVGISYPGIAQLYVAQHPAAAPVRDHAAVGHRRHLSRHALPRRHPQHRVRRVLGQRAHGPGERRTARAGSRSGSTPATAPARTTRSVRLQNPDPLALIEDNPFYSSELGEPITPSLFVPKINVPVFIAGAWQDEQTGGPLAGSARRLHRLTARLRDPGQRLPHRVAEPGRHGQVRRLPRPLRRASGADLRQEPRGSGPGGVADRRGRPQAAAGHRLQRDVVPEGVEDLRVR